MSACDLKKFVSEGHSSWGRILGRNPNKSLQSFPPWDFFYFKLTQPLTVSVKNIGGKPDRKPYPLPCGFRNPYRNLKSENSQLSRLCLEPSMKSFVHEFCFWFELWPELSVRRTMHLVHDVSGPAPISLIFLVFWVWIFSFFIFQISFIS